jgi:SAM-dependent methyltransferase
MSEQYSGNDNLEVMLEAHKYNQFLMDLVARYAPETGEALDFGAGIGTFTQAVSLVRDCIEPDAAARQQLESDGYRTYADIRELNDERYDYIFSLNVLEHIENDGEAVRLLAERLKPGSRLFIYVPAFNHLRTSMDDLVGHHRRYTRGTLLRLLEEAGLEIEQAVYTDFLGYFATLVFRFLDLFKKEPSGQINSKMLVAYDRLVFPVSRVLSVLFSRLVGKNIYAVARKREKAA